MTKEYINNEINKQINTIDAKANKQILEFILTFAYEKAKTNNEIELIRRQFMAGYCYYFAIMLDTAFPSQGTICWCAPFGHIVWVENATRIPYDIEGISTSEAEYYIPISYLGDSILDFMHIPDKTFNASDQQIAQIIEDYKSNN